MQRKGHNAPGCKNGQNVRGSHGQRGQGHAPKGRQNNQRVYSAVIASEVVIQYENKIVFIIDSGATQNMVSSNLGISSCYLMQ